MSVSTIPIAHRDRRGSMLVAGILEIILGSCAILMAALTVFAARSAAAQGASMASMAPGTAVYLCAGAVFITLGIGSINAQRWARALWMSTAVGWLLSGLMAMVFLFLFIPDMFRSMAPAEAPPPQALVVIMAIMGGFFLVFMVIVPLIVFFYYGSADVKATCEAAHPRPAWTDRCPIPVLTAALWLGVTGPMMLMMLVAYGGRFPLFGVMTGPLVGSLFWVLFGVGCVAAALGLYRMKEWGWWTAVALLTLMMVSNVITFTTVNPVELFRIMGITDLQAERLEQTGVVRPGWLIGSSAGAFVPVFLILLWARTALRRSRLAPEIIPD